MKNEREKSDPSKVAERPANKPGQPGAEPAEPREEDQGEHGRATHVPDTEPGKRVPGA
jgi:hypothetical protein